MLNDGDRAMADRQLALTRSTLEALREAFKGTSSRHDQCYCQWNIADDENQDRLIGQNRGPWTAENTIAARSFDIRDANLRFVSPEERTRIIEQNQNAKFFPNSAGQEVYYREPGVTSTIHCRGDVGAFNQFDRLANDAGFCLINILGLTPITLKLPDLVPYNAIAAVKERRASTNQPSDLSDRWIAFLHVLGWQNLSLSPLRAERKVWHENMSFTGDPEELHRMVGTQLFDSFLKNISLPARFFTSTLPSDLNLSSVYAIDALLAGLVNSPVVNTQELQQKLSVIPPGKENAAAFHRLVKELLHFVFEPDLHSPVCEESIDEGRGRIDIVFTNAADRGYFADLAFRHQIKCPVVFFECKNYSSDIGPSEFAQLTSRFSDNRGKVGFLVCRSVANKELAEKRCRDSFVNRREHILVLDDADLIAMLEFKAQGASRKVSQYLHAKFRPVFMNA